MAAVRISSVSKTSIGRMVEIMKIQSRSNSVSFAADGTRKLKSKILRHTEVTNTNHLTPELKLNLITEKCTLWTAKLDQCPFDDPYWAFYWPGGQVLTRYILDNPEIVRGRRVVDVGSGCGASAIATAMGGAALSTANDIDKVAACAISLNAAQNGVTVDINTSDIIGTNCSLWDTILVGDMFYETHFSQQITTWFKALRCFDKTILIGDPGRHAFEDNSALRKELRLIKSYTLTSACMEENRGLHTGHVWLWKGS